MLRRPTSCRESNAADRTTQIARLPGTAFRKRCMGSRRESRLATYASPQMLEQGIRIPRSRPRKRQCRKYATERKRWSLAQKSNRVATWEFGTRTPVTVCFVLTCWSAVNYSRMYKGAVMTIVLDAFRLIVSRVLLLCGVEQRQHLQLGPLKH